MPAKSRYYMHLKQNFSRAWYALERAQSGLRVYPPLWIRNQLHEQPCVKLCPKMALQSVLLRLERMYIVDGNECYPKEMRVWIDSRKHWRGMGLAEMLEGTDEQSLLEKRDDVEVFYEALTYWLGEVAPRAYITSVSTLAYAKSLDGPAEEAQARLLRYNEEKAKARDDEEKRQAIYARSTKYLFLTMAEHKRVNDADSELVRMMQKSETIWGPQGVEYRSVPALLADKAVELAKKPRKPYTRKAPRIFDPQ